MRILYVITQADGGGAQKYTLALAKYFNGAIAAGHVASRATVAGNEAGPVSLATNSADAHGRPEPERGASDVASKLFMDAQRAGLETFELKHLKRNINPWHDVLAVWEIHRLIKFYEPDIVHLNSSKAGILGSFAGIGTKAKIVFTAHGFVFNEPLSIPARNFYLALEKIASGYRDFIITVSDADRQSALDNKIIAADKIATVHNGLPPIDFLPKDRARQELGLDDPLPRIKSGASSNPPPSPIRLGSGRLESDRKADALGEREKRTEPPQTTQKFPDKIIIGNTSNFYRTKGLDVLIDAIAILDKKSLPDFQLAILGKGKLQKDLEQQIARLNLGTKIRLLTNLQCADIYLKAFDIFILPSRKEGFPFALLEAMQAGLPIVATNVGGIPEGLDNAGILVEPENPKTLALAIESLLSNFPKQKELSQKALERSQLFSEQKMLTETEKIYKLVIKK